MVLFRMLTQKSNAQKQDETAFLRSLFLRKSSRLFAVTSVLPLSISFFSRLCLPEPPHISDAWLAGTFWLMPKTRWNISLNY